MDLLTMVQGLENLALRANALAKKIDEGGLRPLDESEKRLVRISTLQNLVEGLEFATTQYLIRGDVGVFEEVVRENTFQE